MRKLIVSVAALACCLGSAVAQDEIKNENPVGRFVTLPAKPATAAQIANPSVVLPTWTSSFTYAGTKYSYYMVGAAPSTGKSTTVKTFIIPVKVSIPGCTTDPTVDKQGSKTVENLTVNSPIFKNMKYTLGGTVVGTTQFEDAFQRANFWNTVKNHTGYHVLLSATPTILPKLTLTPGANGGCGHDFGPLNGLMDINYFDQQANNYIGAHSQITPDTLPIFMTDNLYLTEGGCCIGGYHSATGAQAYSQFTYVTTPGVFSQDTAALSHEIGEWMDDPGVKGSFTPIACGILEVGDPEEGFANYGDFPYKFNGFTYHLQDLVFLEYFGAPNTTSIKGWETFHDNPFGLGICNNGG
jgi:hypothetical protein